MSSNNCMPTHRLDGLSLLTAIMSMMRRPRNRLGGGSEERGPLQRGSPLELFDEPTDLNALLAPDHAGDTDWSFEDY